MPEIYRKDKLLRKSRHTNHKRHVDLTEEAKAKATRCKGDRNTHPCKDPVFRCTVCGNFGCSQDMLEKCSAQGFKNAKCLHCGSVDSDVPIMEDELDHVTSVWEKNHAFIATSGVRQHH